jgi:chaperonin cofactor prefoldin
MSNSHDEIKQLLNVSRKLLGNNNLNEDIRRQYGLLTEQDIDLIDNNVTSKINVTKSVEDRIDYDTADTEEEIESEDDKKQVYRISGGLLVLHGKEQTDLELTTDEKIAFQETMDEFVSNVSDMVDFNKLNVYSNNVEWSGKLIEFDLEFFFSIGEENGVYINGEMIKADNEFINLITKLKNFYEKFKSKWAGVISSRKKTIKTED